MADIDKALPNVKEKVHIESPEETIVETQEKIEEVNDQGVEMVENEDGSVDVEFDPRKVNQPDGEEQFKEIIGGEIPTHLKKKARGGTVETGDIARRQSLVPPLSGPDPQGIMGLYSAPKQVRVG